MNSIDRVSNRLIGAPVDRPPNFNIYMTFAAHAIREKLSSYYTDFRVLSAANFYVIEKFGVDLAQAISDPYREAYDLGIAIEFPEDDLPIRKSLLLSDPAMLNSFIKSKPVIGKRMSDRLEAIRFMKEQVGTSTPVMGWVEGALALAAVLRGFSNLSMDLIDRPLWVKDLLSYCLQVEIQFTLAQIDAGADIIGLGDAVASQISPRMYREFALPYEQEIFQIVRQRNTLARLHICGDTTRILPDMLQSGAHIIDVDHMVDYQKAANLFGNTASICGNMDPVSVFLRGNPHVVRKNTLHCLEVGGARSFSSAGCEIPDRTPIENILAHSEILNTFTSIG